MALPDWIRGVSSDGYSWCSRADHWFEGNAGRNASCYEHRVRPPSAIISDGGKTRVVSYRAESRVRANARDRALRRLASRYPDELEELITEELA